MSISGLAIDKNPWWKDSVATAARAFPVRRRLQPRVLDHVGKLEEHRGILLIGPRKVGKTVLLRQTIDDLLSQGWPPHNITYFDWSDDRITTEVSPREVVDVLPPAYNPDHPRALFLDEIRAATGWDRWLKQAIDNRIGRVVATDSAASLLRGESRESGSRVDELHLEGLTFEEFVLLQGLPGEKLEETIRRVPNVVERYLMVGGFPEHVLADDERLVRERLRRDIVQSAILGDLQPLGIDVERVRRLFVYLMQASGSIFVAAERAVDIGADPRTVSEYLRLLEETMLVASLHKFTGRPSVALRSRPKVYAVDHGLLEAFALTPGTEEVRAAVFEAVVFRHLRDVARASGAELGYFRNDKGTLEVDFILSGRDQRVGIEVTKSTRIRAEKLATLRRVGQVLNARALYLIHGGLEDRTDDGVRLLPISTFLTNPFRVAEEKR